MKRDNTTSNCVAKTKTLISCAVIAQLIGVFVFAHAGGWFSDAAAHSLSSPWLEKRCKWPVVLCKDQKYFHNVWNSIDLRVFSFLQEKISCVFWST